MMILMLQLILGKIPEPGQGSYCVKWQRLGSLITVVVADIHINNPS